MALALPVAGILRGCLQLDAPAHHNRLLCFLPDGEMRPPPPSAARWATICASLLLTQTQVSGRSPRITTCWQRGETT